MKFPIRQFNLIRFEKSNTKNKKYDAIVENKISKKTFRVPFGDSRYETFQDKTGLGLYQIHGDKTRRSLYRKRAQVHVNKSFYSPGYFSFYYLW